MIELYLAEDCPFCVKVRHFLEKAEIPYALKPVPMGRPSKFREELKSLGGKGQVPFLVDPERDVKMYESDLIIDYLRENYAPQLE